MRSVGEDALLLNLDSQQYYRLENVGAKMLQCLLDGLTTPQVIDQIRLEFDAAPEQIASDLQDLVHKLEDQGLIEYG